MKRISILGIFPSPRLLPVLVLAIFSAFGPTSADAKPPARQQENPYRLLDRFGEAIAVVEQEYFEPVDRSTLLDGALRGMLSELDPHSAYFNKEDLRIFEGNTSGRFGGIGVEVDFEGDDVVVIAPVEGSPADRAGIAPGDAIVAIDGQLIDARRPGDLVRTMRGEIGTKVRLTIRRAANDHVVDVVLVREQITVSSVLAVNMNHGVGYMRIKSFKKGTHEELLSGFAKLRENISGAPEEGSLSGVVLDLRNNPGGLVREAVAVADEFLSKGVIYSMRHRGRILKKKSAHSGGAWTKGPLVVLVNEYSASAAELVAGALRDHGRAIVVGAGTFGKGSVQTVLGLSGGGALKLTTALYYTPSSRTIQARGVLPHVSVDPGYVEGSSYRVLKESDLRGHIGEPGEAKPKSRKRGAPPTTEDLHLGVAREVPADPSESKDVALRIAYQIARGRLVRH